MNASQVVPTINTKASAATTSSQKKKFARRDATRSLRQMRGLRRDAEVSAVAIVAPLQRWCCIFARGISPDRLPATAKSGAHGILVRIDRQFGEPFAQGIAVDPEQFGRTQLVAARALQRVFEQGPLERGERRVI